MKTTCLKLARFAAVLSLALWASVPRAAAETNAKLRAAPDAEKPYLGGWALTLPGGWAAWLGVEQNQSQLEANLVWFDGTFGPLAAARIEEGKLVLTRNWLNGIVSTITATVEGDTLKLVQVTPDKNGQGDMKLTFAGQRLPPVPAAPELAKVKFGERIELFSGQDLSGWRLSSAAAEAFNAKASGLRDRSGQELIYPTGDNGWSGRAGVLINDAKQEEGQPNKSFGNLRTDREFGDFNLTLEVRVPEKGLGGIFLRGVYEIQVADSYGRPLRSQSMGGCYSRIAPSAAAEKPSGQWQTLDLTLVDRHVTVILNGQRIIDNQPVLGSTPGALWSDVTRPGPIYLRGDRTSIEFRNLVLRPVVK